jgi:hypothetical protein
MSRNLKWTLLTIIVVLAFALMLVSFASNRKESAEEREREGAVRPPSPVSVHDGQTVITLQPEVQARLGLSVVSLGTSRHSAEQRVPALVLPLQDLGGLRNDYVAAIAKLEKARANLQVSQKEYDRLKGLYHDSQNASAKALEAAEGTLHSDDAEARAAEQSVRIQKDVVRQSWGPVTATWVVQNSASLGRVLEQSEFLVQITVSAGSSSAIPHSVALELPTGSTTSATLVSSFPRVDPRIQGASYLYAAPARPGLTAGVNLVARLAQGAARQGVIVPDTAAVWWEGRAWVYHQTGATTFVRQEVPTDSPAKNGWFVTSGFSPGDKIIVRGSESLLSTELGSQVVGEQGEEEE